MNSSEQDIIPGFLFRFRSKLDELFPGISDRSFLRSFPIFVFLVSIRSSFAPLMSLSRAFFPFAISPTFMVSMRRRIALSFSAAKRNEKNVQPISMMMQSNGSRNLRRLMSRKLESTPYLYRERLLWCRRSPLESESLLLSEDVRLL